MDKKGVSFHTVTVSKLRTPKRFDAVSDCAIQIVSEKRSIPSKYTPPKQSH